MGRGVPEESTAGLWNTRGRRLNARRRFQEYGLRCASVSALRARLLLSDDRLDIRVLGRQLARRKSESQGLWRVSVARSKLMRPCSVRGYGSGTGTWMRHASEQLQHLVSSNDNLPSDVDAANGILRIDLGGRDRPVNLLPPSNQCIKNGGVLAYTRVNEVFFALLIRSTVWQCIVSMHASASKTSSIQQVTVDLADPGAIYPVCGSVLFLMIFLGLWAVILVKH